MKEQVVSRFTVLETLEDGTTKRYHLPAYVESVQPLSGVEALNVARARKALADLAEENGWTIKSWADSGAIAFSTLFVVSLIENTDCADIVESQLRTFMERVHATRRSVH